MSHFQKTQNRPVLAGRAARRQTARVEARATVRELRTRDDKPKPQARVIGHHERALVVISSGWTAREFLAALGCNTEFVAKYESAFGRQCAKAFRESHGTDPGRRAHVILRGRLYRTHSYTDLGNLIDGAKAYARTAALVTAPDFAFASTHQLVHA